MVQGEKRRSRKTSSGGKTKGLTSSSLEKTRVVGMVQQKNTTPPCHVEYNGTGKVRAQGAYRLGGRKFSNYLDKSILEMPEDAP